MLEQSRQLYYPYFYLFDGTRIHSNSISPPTQWVPRWGEIFSWHADNADSNWRLKKISVPIRCKSLGFILASHHKTTNKQVPSLRSWNVFIYLSEKPFFNLAARSQKFQIWILKVPVWVIFKIEFSRTSWLFFGRRGRRCTQSLGANGNRFNFKNNWPLCRFGKQF